GVTALRKTSGTAQSTMTSAVSAIWSSGTASTRVRKTLRFSRARSRLAAETLTNRSPCRPSSRWRPTKRPIDPNPGIATPSVRLVRGVLPVINSNTEFVMGTSRHQLASERPSNHAPLDQHADREQAHSHHCDCNQAGEDQSNVESRGRGHHQKS